MKKIIKKYWVELTLACLLLIVYNQWIFNFGYLTSGDWSFHYREFLKGFFNFPQIWNTYAALGNVDVMPNFSFFKFIYGVISQFFDYSISERIVYFWPIIIFSYIGVIKLGRFIFKNNNIGLFFFGLIFLFNTYILSLQTSFITYASVYALSPLVFYFFIKTFQEQSFKLKNIISSSLLLFLCSLYEIRGFIALLFFLSVYFLLILFDTKLNKLNILFRFISVCLILFLLNIYLLTTFKILESVEIPSTLNLFVAFNSILDSISLHNYSWQGNIFSPFTLVPFHKVTSSFYFFAITILGFSALLFTKIKKIEKKFILFLSASSLIGIFLLKQQNNPFGIIYEFAFKYIPTFNLFRESNKFIINLMLPFSILFGYSVSILLSKIKKKSYKIIIFLFISLLIMVNLKPIFTKEIKTLFVQRSIPTDYLILKDFILRQDDYFRTFWTPTDSRWSIHTNQKPTVGNVGIIGTEWKDYVSFKPNYYNLPTNERIVEVFKIQGANELFDISSIKYVIVPIRDFTNDDDFFIYYGGSENANIREWYISELDKVEWLKKIDIGTKDLVTYENENFRPHIYMTKEQETIYQVLPYEKVAFEQRDPSEYKVHLKNVSEPFYLNFSESYHPDWGVKIGNFNWFSAILEKNYFLKDETHFKNNAGLNYFYIDPGYVCNDNNCTKNEDGSYNFDLTLYFKPQSHFYLGLIISGITLIGITGYLLYDFKKRRKLENKEIEKIEKIL